MDPHAEAWLKALVATPGLTALDLEAARTFLYDDALRGLELVRPLAGPIVDVGSGGGTPGIPLALALPETEFVLLEAERRKWEFLSEWVPSNARAAWGRAEEQEIDWAGGAVAKALAQPAVAAEWCLPLVAPGGAVVLWVGESFDRDVLGAVAARLAGELEPSPKGFAVLRKTGPTPPGFPRRTGVAKKRPLA
jgi:16S rRNA (guanine527-N7)-methyltransferase